MQSGQIVAKEEFTKSPKILLDRFIKEIEIELFIQRHLDD